MSRYTVAALTFLATLSAPALAQMPETPGPGGIPIAPGAPISGYTPGGIGPGGIEIAPGPAARGVPMYRIGPGGIALPPQPDPLPGDTRPRVRLGPEVRETMPQSLVLTIHSRDAGPAQAPAPDKPIDAIADLFAALRACWEPPTRDQAQEGVEMTVRFSLNRTGEMIAAPRVTYTTRGIAPAMKQTYQEAITASLTRCAPVPLSKSFSIAIAGRPISVRYVDDRNLSASSRP